MTLLRTNYATNPQPASASTNWTYQNATSEAGSTGVNTTAGAGPDGSTGFQRRTVSTAPTGGTGGHIYTQPAGAISGAASSVVAGSMWVRASVALQVRAVVTVRSGGSTVSTATGPVVTLVPNTWTRISSVVTATGSYDGAQVSAVVQNPTLLAIGATNDAAQVLIEKASTLGPWFSGATTDDEDHTYDWTGTANASTSTQSTSPGIYAELLPDPGAPQVGLTVDGLDATPSVITVHVSWDEGETWHGVRGAESVTVIGGTFVRDHVPPLNVSATYRLTVESGAVVPLHLEDSILVTSTSAWIQDPLAPRTAVPLSGARNGTTIMLLAGSGASMSRRQAVDMATPQGARYPVASVGRRQAASSIPLHLRGLAAEQGALVKALRALFDQAGALVIRGLPADVPIDPVAHVVAGDIDEVPVVGGLLGFRNDWLLDLSQVAPTSMRIVVPWWTYDQVKALWAVDSSTYDDVLAARPGDTYIDWLRDPEVP